MDLLGCDNQRQTLPHEERQRGWRQEGYGDERAEAAGVVAFGGGISSAPCMAPSTLMVIWLQEKSLLGGRRDRFGARPLPVATPA